MPWPKPMEHGRSGAPTTMGVSVGKSPAVFVHLGDQTLRISKPGERGGHNFILRPGVIFELSLL